MQRHFYYFFKTRPIVFTKIALLHMQRTEQNRIDGRTGWDGDSILSIYIGIYHISNPEETSKTNLLRFYVGF